MGHGTYDFRDRTASDKKPLYGHDSPQTAYMIDDYPSGFKARCRKRVWLEFKPKQGWRLVEQTSDKWYPGEEPAKDAVLRWNKPKASVYAQMAACMYVDAQDHVQWEQLGLHDKPAVVLEFAKDFPKADFGAIKAWVATQFRYIKGKMLGQVAFSDGGNVKPWSDHELGEARSDLGLWAEVAKAVDFKVPGDIQDLIDGKLEAKQVDPEAFAAQHKLKQEEAAAARAEEIEKTPGAQSYDEFKEYLASKLKLDGRVVRISGHSKGSGQMFVNFFNLPEAVVGAGRGGGAEAENNRQMFVVVGFDRNDPKAVVPKVKVELSASTLRGEGESYSESRARTNLRGKTGAPAKVAEYLAAHINKMVKEIEPRLTHEKIVVASYGPR